MDYFLDMESEYADYNRAKYVIFPVPYDGTSTFVKGSDKAPQAIIDASDSIELYDIEFDEKPYLKGIHTAKFVTENTSSESMVQAVYGEVKNCFNAKKIPIIIGGEHSVSIGAIQAANECHANISVLQIDAHADLRPVYNDSKYNHACVMRRAQEICAAGVVQVGIRNVCEEEKEFIVPENIFYAHRILRDKTEQWMPEALSRLTDKVYLTIDVDGFDPSVFPATGTPLPGGLLWTQTLDFLEQLFQQKTVVGFDIVELCPNPYDKSSDVAAAVLLYKILCLFEKHQK